MFKTELAYENWEKNYKYKDETPIETFERVARALASVEKDKDKWFSKFITTMVKFKEGKAVGLKCTPGGRITANAGTDFKGATLMNCFVNGPVSDATISYKRKSEDGSIEYPVKIKSSSNPDDLTNIFLTILEQAKTLASEGGYGLNFSFIRPRGTLIKGIGIKHPGVIAYMEVWDSVAECIVKGTSDGYIDKIKNYLGEEKVEIIKNATKKAARKGAMMCVLSSSHPDIEEFIRAKQMSGKLTKFNMSIAVDDELMKAVINDEFYDLHFEGKVYKRVKARELYNLMMDSAYNRGEPGIIFVDNMQKNNPIEYLGKPTACNPCGEVPGLASLTTVCLLGSVNLTQYINDKREFDWKEYEEDIAIFTRMLDNVIDISSNSLPSYDWAMKNMRQIGMGINGLGSALMMMGIPYNSKEAVAFIKKAGDIKENITMKTSALLAEEKGVCAVYIKDKFENTQYFKSDRLNEETKNLIRRNGLRNAKTTNNPPLGNSSFVCDNVSNGIEPVFSFEYERKIVCHKWPEGLTSENVKKVLKEHKKKDFSYWQGKYEGKEYYYEPQNRGLCTVVVVRDYGYKWLLDNFPKEDHSKYLVSTKDIKIEDHIAIQEVVQYHLNQSVSKTANLPEKYPMAEFRKLYIDAWKRGLNGFTTYLTNSMEAVLEHIDHKETKQEIIKQDIHLPKEFLNGPMRVIEREGMKFYINFSYLPDDTKMTFPICIWIKTNSTKKETIACNKASKELHNLALKSGIANKFCDSTMEKAKDDAPYNKLGRMISLCLRHNIPLDKIYSSLVGIEGDNLSSLLTAVRKFLSEKIADGTKSNMKCPSCKSENVVFQSGCHTCRDCSWAGCS